MDDLTENVELKPAPGDDGATAAEAALADDSVLYCAVHPTVETTLRCNKCGRPMCTRCAVPTPVGYRCKECVRGQQDVFYKATNLDYGIAGGISLAMGLVAGFIVPQLGLLFALILSPVAGGLIAQVVLWATKRRRGRYTGYVVAAGIVVGALPALWDPLRWLLLGVPAGELLFLLAGPVIYVGLAAGVAYSWFRFGR